MSPPKRLVEKEEVEEAVEPQPPVVELEKEEEVPSPEVADEAPKLDESLSSTYARPSALSEPVTESRYGWLHCSMCRNKAPANPARPGWVNCPRCHAQPSVEVDG